MQEAIDAWEGEGGGLRQSAEERVAPRFVFARGGPVAAEKKMIGTVNQVEWAERIKRQVSAEFDRVAKALESAAWQAGRAKAQGDSDCNRNPRRQAGRSDGTRSGRLFHP